MKLIEFLLSIKVRYVSFVPFSFANSFERFKFKNGFFERVRTVLVLVRIEKRTRTKSENERVRTFAFLTALSASSRNLC